MGSINEEYIIKPFTVDDKGSITLDDAFSVSIDDNNIFLNIHVSLIGFEFIQDCYSFDDLWKETKSTKIRKYLGEDIT
jgi:hypothetical protein